MPFKNLLEAYPSFTLFWELFKGIAPTAVALIAIYINNKSTRKRDIRNKKTDIQLEMLNKMWDGVVQLDEELNYLISKVAPCEKECFCNEEQELDACDDLFDKIDMCLNLNYKIKLCAERYELISDECFISWNFYNLVDNTIEIIQNTYGQNSESMSINEQIEKNQDWIDKYVVECKVYLESIGKKIKKLVN